MAETAIEWTHRPGTTGAVWNATVGCRRASPGCENCYAESMAGRIVRMGGVASAAYAPVVRTNKRGLSVWNGSVASLPDRLDMPLRWKKPRTVFVNSMSDLFHEDVTDEFIAAVFGVMAATPQHTYIILTKRAERLPQWFAWMDSHGRDSFNGHPARLHACWEALRAELEHHPLGDSGPLHCKHGADPDGPWPLPNVQLGVSCENQEWFDKRVPFLLRTPAAVRLVSLEPLLGPIDASRALKPTLIANDGERLQHPDPRVRSTGGTWEWGLNWVITGGESGRERRACEVEWIESIAQQCAAARVPCFVKQDSAFKPGQQGRIPDAVWALKQFPRLP